MSPREIILTLHFKLNGDWDAIRFYIKKQILITKEEKDKYLKYVNVDLYTTIFDVDYPEHLRQLSKPPFVVKK